MNSLWQSFSRARGSEPSKSNSIHSQSEQTLPNLLLLLVNSGFSDLSVNEGLHPDSGPCLGSGATFVVERKQRVRDGIFVAVKHIVRDEDPLTIDITQSTATRYRLRDVLLEAQALLHWPLQDHRNIVKLLGYGWDSGTVPFLVTEFANLGALGNFLRNSPTTAGQKTQISIDIASALDVLHECGVIHGDLKLENVLVFSDADNGFIVKLSDFGFCCSSALGNEVYRGTSLINAPEVRNHYSTFHEGIDLCLDYRMCDVYAYGILVWEVFADGVRFYSTYPMEIAPENTEETTAVLSSLDQEGTDLISYANDFIDHLDPLLPSASVLKNVFETTLKSDPSERSGMYEVRLLLELENVWVIRTQTEVSNPTLTLNARNEAAYATPIRAPCYTMFNLVNQPVPWRIQNMLAQRFIHGALDSSNEYRGADAFGAATCFAVGFGLQMEMEKAYDFLKLSAENDNITGRVLFKTFCNYGLVQGSEDQNPNGHFEEILHDTFLQVDPRNPARMTSQLIRNHYKAKDRLAAFCPLSVGSKAFADQEDDFRAYISRSNVGNLSNHMDVTVHLPGGDIHQTLIGHLIRSHPILAESVIRRGWEWTEDMKGDNSPLLIACACGATNVVQALLELYPWMARKSTQHGISPLHWLFMFSDQEIPEIAQSMLKSGCFLKHVGITFLVDFNMVFSGPPLHWAIMSRNHAACQTLIDMGVDINSGSSVPSLACQFPPSPVDLAVSLCLPDVTKLLLERGATIGKRDFVSGLTALHYVGDFIDPFRLLLYHGRLTREAIRETIEALIDHGAQILEPSDEGVQPLPWIVMSTTRCDSVLKAFLPYHSPTDIEVFSSSILEKAAIALQHDQLNAQKVASLLKVLEGSQSREIFLEACAVALERCSRDNTLQAARLLLEKLGPNAANTINEWELLHLAAYENHVDLIRLFIDFGANIDLDVNGTPAAVAASEANREALYELLNHKANFLSYPSTESQRTLLHEIAGSTSSTWYVEQTMAAMCEKYAGLLMQVVDHYDRNGLTALHEAIVRGHLKPVALLIQRLHAAGKPVRGTLLSPTTLGYLAQKSPPRDIEQNGKHAVENHKLQVSAILGYLVETCGMNPPDEAVSEDDRPMSFFRSLTGRMMKIEM